jgi:predicted DNA-binding ribbon-helix-helix protein
LRDRLTERTVFLVVVLQFHFRGAVIVMKSPIVKRSIVVAGHKTSVSLEDTFWEALKEIARKRRTTVSRLVSSINVRREHGNLSSSIRLFVFDHYRYQNSAETDEAPPRRLAS